MSEARHPFTALYTENSVLIHPTAVDFIQSESATRFGHPVALTDIALPHVESALTQLDTILKLQAGRDSTSRAVRVGGNIDHSGLRPISAYSLRLMERVGRVASALEISPMYHGLSDVNSVEKDDAGKLFLDTYKEVPIAIRTEADLTPQAADIAHTIRQNMENTKIENARMLNEQVAARDTDTGTASFLLYGYTFRSDPSKPETAVKFPAFPACESFLAATVLEQVVMADAVVRIVPRTFKKKEYAAKWMLEALGIKDLPVVSIAVGDTGDVNKVIRWSRQPNEALSAIVQGLRAQPSESEQ